MNDNQLDFVSSLLLRKTQLKTARAFHLKLVFQDFYLQPRSHAETYLKKWCSWAVRSRVPAMVAAARTIRNHWDGVLRWFTSKITNGLLKGINSLIQAAKAKYSAPEKGVQPLRRRPAICFVAAPRRWPRIASSRRLAAGRPALANAGHLFPGHCTKARGYRTSRNLIAIVYLLAGKLELNLSHL